MKKILIGALAIGALFAAIGCDSKPAEPTAQQKEQQQEATKQEQDKSPENTAQ